jgi:hypothetical protein
MRICFFAEDFCNRECTRIDAKESIFKFAFHWRPFAVGSSSLVAARPGNRTEVRLHRCFLVGSGVL